METVYHIIFEDGSVRHLGRISPEDAQRLLVKEVMSGKKADLVGTSTKQGVAALSNC